MPRSCSERVSRAHSGRRAPASSPRHCPWSAAPTLGGRRLTVRRGTEGRGDDYFELRLQPAEAGSVAAAVFDTTETHRLDAAIAALASSTVALDASGRMSWRPFGNAARFKVDDEDALGVNVLQWVHPDELPRYSSSSVG